MMIFDNLNSLFSRAMHKGVSPEMREALSVLSDDMIEDRNQRLIFNAIKELDNFNSVVSSRSVESLVIDDVPFSVLIETAGAVPTDQPLRTAMQVVSVYNDNQANHQLKQITSILSAGRPFNREEISQQLSSLSQLVAPVATSKPKSFGDYAEGYADVLEYRQENPNSSGLDIGLDVNIERTALVVLGGQPGINFYQVPSVA